MAAPMKITTNTPDLLIVEDRPWFLGFALIGFTLIFVAVGLSIIASGEWGTGIFTIVVGAGSGIAAFAAFVRRAQAVFNRAEGWVELRNRNAFGGKVVRHALNEVTRATLEHLSDSDRVSLVIEEGQSAGIHPITPVFSSNSNHAAVVQDIDAWLKRDQAKSA